MRLRLRRIHQADFSTLMAWVHTKEELVQWSGPWNFEFPLDELKLAKFFLTEMLDDKINRAQFMAIDEDTGEPVGQIGFSGRRLRTRFHHPRLGSAHLSRRCGGHR